MAGALGYDPNSGLAPPTPVQTVPIGPAEAVPDQPPEPAQPGMAAEYAPLLAALRERMLHPASDKMTPREKFSEMLTNFGRGMIQSASNVQGRSTGPGLGESFAGGASALGETALDQNKEERSSNTAEQARMDSLLKDYFGASKDVGELDLKERGVRTLEDYRKKLGDAAMANSKAQNGVWSAHVAGLYKTINSPYSSPEEKAQAQAELTQFLAAIGTAQKNGLGGALGIPSVEDDAGSSLQGG